MPSFACCLYTCSCWLHKDLTEVCFQFRKTCNQARVSLHAHRMSATCLHYSV